MIGPAPGAEQALDSTQQRSIELRARTQNDQATVSGALDRFTDEPGLILDADDQPRRASSRTQAIDDVVDLVLVRVRADQRHNDLVRVHDETRSTKAIAPAECPPV